MLHTRPSARPGREVKVMGTVFRWGLPNSREKSKLFIEITLDRGKCCEEKIIKGRAKRVSKTA